MANQDKTIIFFIGTLCVGGAERVVSVISNKLAEEKYPVEIITYYDRTVHYTISKSIKLTSIERETSSQNIIKNLLFLRRYIKLNAGTVVSFMAIFNMLAIIAGIGLKIPIYVADRSDPRVEPSNIFMRKLRNFSYNFATGVVLQTQGNKKYFSKYIQSKSRVIFNPVDIGDNEGLALRTVKQNRIVSVGRLVKEKKQKTIINAFALLYHIYPEYELTIYGEGPCRNALEQRIEELGLTSAVSMPGTVEDIPGQIADAKLFVLTSDHEGMPNSLIEAMCLGLPVISTKVSGATDVIIDGVNGLLLDANDEKTLAREMKKILTNTRNMNFIANNAVLLNKKLEVKKICDEWKDFIM